MDSQDYDLQQVLEQTIEFLFSARGDFIREQLVEEIIKAVDQQGRRNWDNFTSSIQSSLGPAPPEKPIVNIATKVETISSFDQIKRIWDILQETPGFDGMQVIALVPKLLGKPETQQMGQKIASGLAQRAIARLIREVLAPPEPQPRIPTSSSSPAIPYPPPLGLPASRY